MTHIHRPGEAQNHAHPQGARTALTRALAVTLAFACVEALVGFFSGSLALLSDAAHMLVDSGALALAMFAQRFAGRARTESHTFGYRRAEVLAAAVSGGALLTVSIGIVVEAVGRLGSVRQIRGDWMLGTAITGLVVNVLSGLVLTREASASINVRAALAHVMADALGSVAAIGAAVAVIRFNLPEADSIASIAISVLIFWGASGLIRESAAILMEGAPAGVKAAAIEATIRATPGVRDLHDLHVWMISDGFPVVTVHVVLDGQAHGTGVAREVSERLAKEHGIEHVTVQPEARLEPEAPLPMRPRAAIR